MAHITPHKNDSNESHFVVYRRNTGGEYLVERSKRTVSGPKYRWAKNGLMNAVVYNNRKSASRTAKKYGGQVLEIV